MTFLLHHNDTIFQIKNQLCAIILCFVNHCCKAKRPTLHINEGGLFLLIFLLFGCEIKLVSVSLSVSYSFNYPKYHRRRKKEHRYDIEYDHISV